MDDIQTKPVISYATEILNLIRINCKDTIRLLKANYTARGVEAEVVDSFDGQIYHIIIESRYKYEGGQQRQVTYEEDVARRKEQIQISQTNEQFREEHPNFG